VSDLASIRRVVRVAAALRARAALADEDADWLATALEGGDLELLLDVRTKLGRKFSTQLAHERSIDLHRQAAMRLPLDPGASQASQARQLRIELANYYTGTWRHHRALEDCPAPAGSLREACWSILKNRDRLLSERTIRDLLSART
jgi:hypothetical protein